MGFLKKHLVVKGAEEAKGLNALLDNDDIRPLALKDRTWTGYTYFTFWFSAAATGMSIPSLSGIDEAEKYAVSNWYGASAAQALGLSMWESLACSFGGQILIAIVITFNGRAGAVYHVGFPVLNRCCFGVLGALVSS